MGDIDNIDRHQQIEKERDHNAMTSVSITRAWRVADHAA
jgi:hypothetical protein